MQQRVKRTQGERSEQTQKQLIEAAIDLVMERGLANATVTEICRRAAVTTGALQHHFGSKSELMATVVAQLFAPFTREIEPTVDPRGVPLDARIERLVQRYWKIYSDPRYFAVVEILSAVRHDPLLNQIVSRHRSEQVVLLEGFLPQEFPEVALSPVQMRETVHFVLDLMRGFAIRTLFERDPDTDREVVSRCCGIIHGDFAPKVSPVVSAGALPRKGRR